MFQLLAVLTSSSDLDSGDCKPVTSDGGKPYYPCGLIANSVFNGELEVWAVTTTDESSTDTFPSVVLLNSPSLYDQRASLIVVDGQQNQTYNFTENGIAWGGIAKNYAATPGYESPSDVLPPPNWALRYPNGYTEFPDLHNDEHFQVWMRVAALPTFRKLWARNDNEIMHSGRYRVTAYMSGFRPRQN
jgi:hypothetical protein